MRLSFHFNKKFLNAYEWRKFIERTFKCQLLRSKKKSSDDFEAILYQINYCLQEFNEYDKYGKMTLEALCVCCF